MKIFLFLICTLIGSSSFANESIAIEKSCEDAVIKEAIGNKETGLFLEFYVDSVTAQENENVLVVIKGYFSDAAEDYGYEETHEIIVNQKTCTIISSELTDIFEQ